jgi:hypothetical protein
MKHALVQLRKLRTARRDAMARQLAQAQRKAADAQAMLGTAQDSVGEADAWLAAARRPARLAAPQATQMRAARVAQAAALAQRRLEAMDSAANLARRCSDDLATTRGKLLGAQRGLQKFDAWDELESNARSALDLGVELEDEAEAGAASHQRNLVSGRA